MRITTKVLNNKIASVIELAESKGIKYVDTLNRYPVANLYIYHSYGYPTLACVEEYGTGETSSLCSARDNRGIYQWLRGYARALQLI